MKNYKKSIRNYKKSIRNQWVTVYQSLGMSRSPKQKRIEQPIGKPWPLDGADQIKKSGKTTDFD